MNYIILDLEATCWQGKALAPNETIEIGAVCINHQKQILGEFNQFIKPAQSDQLSDFCTELTSITQEMVENAPYFPAAIQAFQHWIQSFGGDYLLCSWGKYDRNQFERDSKYHRLPIAWLKKHISLKHQYSDILGTRKRFGMKGALQKEGIPLTGTHHRGIDDAKNIAQIFLAHFGKWQHPVLK
ncbi:MAG: exonuclease domain-containing protein [Flammeovirgaceae bacterium]